MTVESYAPVLQNVLANSWLTMSVDQKWLSVEGSYCLQLLTKKQGISYRPSNWKDYKTKQKKQQQQTIMIEYETLIITRIVTWYFANLHRWKKDEPWCRQ